MSQTITNYEYDMDYRYEKTDDVYQLTAKNRITKVIVKILSKLNIIKPYEQRITVRAAKQYSIDEREIINDLCNKIAMHRYAMDNNIAGIMVGREQFGLIREDYVKSSISFMTQFGYMDNGRQRIEDVPLVLNPFMDGVVFVTRDMIAAMK